MARSPLLAFAQQEDSDHATIHIALYKRGRRYGSRSTLDDPLHRCHFALSDRLKTPILQNRSTKTSRQISLLFMKMLVHPSNPALNFCFRASHSPSRRPFSAAMTSLIQASTSPSPYAPSVLCPPADDDAFACAPKEAAEAEAEQQRTTQRLAELTMESPCIPIGIACAASAMPADAKCDAAAAASSLSSPAPLPTDRLAAVNSFKLNPDEPKRSMQELVHSLMQELEGGEASSTSERASERACESIPSLDVQPLIRSPRVCPPLLVCCAGKKDLNRLYNIMMSYDASGNEWKRYEFIDEKVSGATDFSRACPVSRLSRVCALKLFFEFRAHVKFGEAHAMLVVLFAQKKYTRNLIACVPNSFCLMLLCWNPEKGSPIHNHAGSSHLILWQQQSARRMRDRRSLTRAFSVCARPGSECFMRVIEGEIIERQFVVKGGEGDQAAKCNWNKMVSSNIPASDLTLTHKNEYKAGGCTFINDSLGVHAVENPFKQSAVTLHCYVRLGLRCTAARGLRCCFAGVAPVPSPHCFLLLSCLFLCRFPAMTRASLSSRIAMRRIRPSASRCSNATSHSIRNRERGRTTKQQRSSPTLALLLPSSLVTIISTPLHSRRSTRSCSAFSTLLPSAETRPVSQRPFPSRAACSARPGRSGAVRSLVAAFFATPVCHPLRLLAVFLTPCWTRRTRCCLPPLARSHSHLSPPAHPPPSSPRALPGHRSSPPFRPKRLCRRSEHSQRTRRLAPIHSPAAT